MMPPVIADGNSQSNFLADEMGEDVDVPRLHSTPRLNLQPPMIGVSALPRNSISSNDPEDQQPNFVKVNMARIAWRANDVQ